MPVKRADTFLHPVVLIIQARMSSSRYPGKVLKPICGKPMLGHLIDQLQAVQLANRLVIATSLQREDDAIVAYCEEKQTPSFRGSLEDVLARYASAADAYKAATVVRICADSPLTDPEVVDQVIGYYLAHHLDYDYVSNCLERTYPLGVAVEVFSRALLNRIAQEAKHPEEREHVTPFIYRHPELFRLKNIALEPPQAHQRWCVDTAEDFDLVSRLLEALQQKKGPPYTMRDVLQVLEQHPDWPQINAHVTQRTVSRDSS